MSEFVRADDGWCYRRSLVTSFRERYTKGAAYVDARLGEGEDGGYVTFDMREWNRRSLVTVVAAPPGYFVVRAFEPEKGSEVDHVTVPILAWGVDVDGALHALTAEDEGDRDQSAVFNLTILCPMGCVTSYDRMWCSRGEYLESQRALRNQTPA